MCISGQQLVICVALKQKGVRSGTTLYLKSIHQNSPITIIAASKIAPILRKIYSTYKNQYKVYRVLARFWRQRVGFKTCGKKIQVVNGQLLQTLGYFLLQGTWPLGIAAVLFSNQRQMIYWQLKFQDSCVFEIVIEATIFCHTFCKSFVQFTVKMCGKNRCFTGCDVSCKRSMGDKYAESAIPFQFCFRFHPPLV